MHLVRRILFFSSLILVLGYLFQNCSEYEGLEHVESSSVSPQQTGENPEIHFAGEFAIFSSRGKNLYVDEVTTLKVEILRPDPIEIEYVEWFQKNSQGEERKLDETVGLELQWKAVNMGLHQIHAVIHSREAAKPSDPTSLNVAPGIRNGRKPTFLKVPEDAVVLQGQSLVLETQADGFPTPNYKWFKDGIELPSSFSSLGIQSFKREDNGLYKIVASNVEGSVESPLFKLRMAEPLLITAQPDGRTIASGQSSVFNVTVSGGEAPLTYEWRKNGEKIGEMKSYTIDDAKEAHEGNYRVLIKDSLGQKILSEIATLKVNTPYQVEECKNFGASRNSPNFNDGYVKFWSPTPKTAQKICQSHGYKIVKSYDQNIPDQKGWAPYYNLRIYSWNGNWNILCEHGSNCFTKKTPFIVKLRCCNTVDKIR